MKKVSLFIALLCSCLVTSNCSSGGGSGDGGGQGSSSLSLETREAQSVTNSSGIATFTVIVPDGATGLQLVAATGATGTLRLANIVNASGTSVMSSTSEVGTRLNRESLSPLAVNMPYSGAALRAGTYTVTVQVSSSRDVVAGASVDLKAFIKKDANLSSGTLKVNLVYLGPVADSQEVRDAVKESISTMRQTFSRAGITVDLQEFDYAGPSTANSPVVGDAIYTQISSALRQQAVNIVLATDLTKLKFQGSGGDYGNAGNEPGAVIAGPESAVAISILNVTSDGRFDYRGNNGGSAEHNDEKRLLGEEMVRLTANYLGLADVIEFTGARVSSSDTIGDSPACISKVGCRSDSTARTNAMMPIPLLKLEDDRDFDDDSTTSTQYYPRDQWSAGQIAVLNSSVFVD